MYQRKGKMVAKEPANLNSMGLVSFLKEASSQLELNDEKDASHYFDMVIDHIRSGKPLSSDVRQVSKILGL
jgi:hypothetical protein